MSFHTAVVLFLFNISQGNSTAAFAQVALTANEPAEATAGAGVIASFCEEHREGQQLLASTFMPVTEPSAPQQGLCKLLPVLLDDRIWHGRHSHVRTASSHLVLYLCGSII